MAAPDLPLAEWIVLALIAERPQHGFAVSALTGADTELGGLWTISRPMVYRSIGQLSDRQLLVVADQEPGDRGPRRVVYAATPAAKVTATRWLSRPVSHLRDVRADLLVKIAILHRRHADPTVLLQRQRRVVEKHEAALLKRVQVTDGLDRAVVQWRLDQARATLRLIDTF